MFTPTVKPDATPEEVQAVVNDDQGGQVFSQAVSLESYCLRIYS
jgi:t-SNARE complex subunit (syntaxin)